MSPVPERFDLDLGDGHWLTFVDYKGDPRAGARQPHLTDKTETGMCEGWITFEGSAWAAEFDNRIPTWKVECWEPLTLSPSLLCRGCGDHGFIRAGKWVRA